MSSANFNKAQKLIKQGKYTEARSILQSINHPMALDLIAQIERIEAGEKVKINVVKESHPARTVGCLLLLVIGVMIIIAGTSGKSAQTVLRPTTIVSSDTPAPTETAGPSPTPLAVIDVTRTQQSANKTATDDSIQSTKDFLSLYKPIARGELVSYADNHVGDNVIIKGRVFHVIDSETLQLFMAGSNDAIYIKAASAFGSIYENDFITVYGTVGGFAEGTNAFGGSVKQPEIDDATLVK